MVRTIMPRIAEQSASCTLWFGRRHIGDAKTQLRDEAANTKTKMTKSPSHHRTTSKRIDNLLPIANPLVVCPEGFVRTKDGWVRGQYYGNGKIDCSKCDFPGCELGLSRARRYLPPSSVNVERTN